MFKQYAEILKINLDKCFDDQKEFLFCNAGCSFCCVINSYPISKLEYEYIRIGLSTLTASMKKLVAEMAFDVKEQYELFLKQGSKGKFTYTCPFLFEKTCKIYEYRPVVCRTHGLAYINPNNPETCHYPCCITYDLNYSTIVEKLGESSYVFSQEKVSKLNPKNSPKAFNLDISAFQTFARQHNMTEMKEIYEWILGDLANYR